MSALTRITTDQAIAVLFEDAASDPAIVANKLAEAARHDPTGLKAFKALFKSAGVEALGNVSTAAQSSCQTRFPLVIGQPVTDRGIPFSQLTSGGKTINLNLIPDFLRDASGNIVELTGNQAVAAVKAFNGGAQHGNGYEKATNRAVARSEFKDGTIILARQSDLLKIAGELGTNPAIKQMNEIIASGSGIDSWCVSSTEVSGTEASGLSSYVRHVRLKDGASDWYHKDSSRSRVVVLRGANCG
jgi:hypothetical protein